jgi:hypothetical protein
MVWNILKSVIAENCGSKNVCAVIGVRGCVCARMCVCGVCVRGCVCAVCACGVCVRCVCGGRVIRVRG